MKPGPTFLDSALRLRPAPPAPKLLVTLEPWHRTFFDNVRDLVWPRRRSPLVLTSDPGIFWHDVFVSSRMPWGSLAESVLYHAVAIALLWGSARLFPPRPRMVEKAVFHSSDVIYYDAPEYLQPLDTGGARASLDKKGDPEFARQPILSVPANADNHRQTIVTPPKLKLKEDVPLPNVVAWSRAQPEIPIAATATKLQLPSLPNAVVAPPPEISKSRFDQAPNLEGSVIAPAPSIAEPAAKRSVQIPMPAVVEPAPAMETAGSRKLTDINIGPAQVIAPAPQLPMGEQRALSTARKPSLGNAETTVVAPPPSVQGAGLAGGAVRGDGQLVALSLHPVPPSASVDVPNGNRRGTFAATPEGRPGATGTPDPPTIKNSSGVGGNQAGNGVGSSRSVNGLPSGLYVGAPKLGAGSAVTGAGNSSGEPGMMASAAPAGKAAMPRAVAAEMDPSQQTDEERRVFAGRKSYAMTLNMPNLNSAGGSWVMHFVEMKEDQKPSGDLFAPVPTRTADPGYPLELMKQNVHGTVTLTAVIHSDGHVADVSVLNGIDDRLDRYACAALLRWQFLPAVRNGSAVPLKAVVMIPFRPRRAF